MNRPPPPVSISLDHISGPRSPYVFGPIWELLPDSITTSSSLTSPPSWVCHPFAVLCGFTLSLPHKQYICVCVLAHVCVLSHVWLCDPMDSSPPGSSVHGILQARILEWVVIPSSRGSSWPRDETWISCTSCNSRQILYHWATWKAQTIYLV